MNILKGRKKIKKPLEPDLSQKIDREEFTVQNMDIFGDTQHSRGTKRLMEVFSPLLLLFEINPTGNLFKDFRDLSEKLSNERFFLSRIFSKIFDQYDKDGNGIIDESELALLLQDVGVAIEDESLMYISIPRVRKIFEKIDQDDDGKIDRDELIEYLINWVEEEDEYISPVRAIPRKESVPFTPRSRGSDEIKMVEKLGKGVEESGRGDDRFRKLDDIQDDLFVVKQDSSSDSSRMSGIEDIKKSADSESLSDKIVDEIDVIVRTTKKGSAIDDDSYEWENPVDDIKFRESFSDDSDGGIEEDDV